MALTDEQLLAAERARCEKYDDALTAIMCDPCNFVEVIEDGETVRYNAQMLSVLERRIATCCKRIEQLEKKCRKVKFVRFGGGNQCPC